MFPTVYRLYWYTGKILIGITLKISPEYQYIRQKSLNTLYTGNSSKTYSYTVANSTNNLSEKRLMYFFNHNCTPPCKIPFLFVFRCQLPVYFTVLMICRKGCKKGLLARMTVLYQITWKWRANSGKLVSNFYSLARDHDKRANWDLELNGGGDQRDPSYTYTTEIPNFN